MWGPPLGGPPRGPPGVPGCQRVLEKIAKILKKYIKNLHSSKYTKFKLLTFILIHLGYLGGPNLDLTRGGGFLHRIKKFKNQNMFL